MTCIGFGGQSLIFVILDCQTRSHCHQRFSHEQQTFSQAKIKKQSHRHIINSSTSSTNKTSHRIKPEYHQRHRQKQSSTHRDSIHIIKTHNYLRPHKLARTVASFADSTSLPSSPPWSLSFSRAACAPLSDLDTAADTCRVRGDGGACIRQMAL